MKITLIPITLASLITPLAMAAEETAKGEWQSSIEVGFVSTSGNTETESLNLKAETKSDREKWRHNLSASVLKASETNQTTAEKYALSGKSDYKLEDPAYLLATATYEDDKFSGFDYQATLAVGYGRRVFEAPDKTLDLEIGPGVRQSKLNNGQTNNEGLLRFGANFDWQISETSQFAEALTIEAGEDSTISKSETSLTSQINGKLSMKLTLTLKNNSDAPLGTKKTDSETSATLVYSF